MESLPGCWRRLYWSYFIMWGGTRSWLRPFLTFGYYCSEFSFFFHCKNSGIITSRDCCISGKGCSEVSLWWLWPHRLQGSGCGCLVSWKPISFPIMSGKWQRICKSSQKKILRVRGSEKRRMNVIWLNCLRPTFRSWFKLILPRAWWSVCLSV